MDGAGVSAGVGRAWANAVAAPLATHNCHHGAIAGPSSASLRRRNCGGWRGHLLHVECSRRQLMPYPGKVTKEAKTAGNAWRNHPQKTAQSYAKSAESGKSWW